MGGFSMRDNIQIYSSFMTGGGEVCCRFTDNYALASPCSPFSSTSFVIPRHPISSPAVNMILMPPSGGASANALIDASIIAARPPFISLEPLPQILPFFTSRQMDQLSIPYCPEGQYQSDPRELLVVFLKTIPFSAIRCKRLTSKTGYSILKPCPASKPPINFAISSSLPGGFIVLKESSFFVREITSISTRQKIKVPIQKQRYKRQPQNNRND